jgi:hypothetical protein
MKSTASFSSRRCEGLAVVETVLTALGRLDLMDAAVYLVAPCFIMRCVEAPSRRLLPRGEAGFG